MKKILTLLLIANAFYSKATTIYQETKKAKIAIDVKASDDLIFQMENTPLTIRPWDKNEVLIEATIKCKTTPNERQLEILNNWNQLVKNNIDNNYGSLKIGSAVAETEVTTKKTFLGIVIYMSVVSDKSLDVEYIVNVPKNNPLEVKGSYKDIHITDDIESLNLYLYSAKLRAKSVASANLELKYGKAYLDKIEKGKITLYENDITVSSLGIANINAKYSTIETQKISNCEIEGYESKFKSESIDKLLGSLKYCQVDVFINLKSGALEVYETDIKAGKVDSLKLVDSKYSKFKFMSANLLHFESSYEDEIETKLLGTLQSLNTKYGNYEIENLKNKFQINGYEDELAINAIDELVSEIEIKGKYIEASLTTGSTPILLSINSQYGNINLSESSLEFKNYTNESSKTSLLAYSKIKSEKPTNIVIDGYEMRISLDTE